MGRVHSLFFGFLQSGEITCPTQATFDASYHLTVADVAVDSVQQPRMVQVNIKASKTDPFRQGVCIYLGRTDNQLCPVAALLAYLAVRGNRPGPLFVFSNGQYLTRAALVREIRKALGAAGICGDTYSGHSFRIGVATTAAAAGLQDAVIKALGRWNSSAYQLYVRTPREHLAQVAVLLANV